MSIYRIRHTAFLLLLLLLLAGCASSTTPPTAEPEPTGQNAAEPGTAGQDDRGQGASEQGESPDSAAEQPASSTRIINTAVGDIEIPSHPQRVIVDWNIGHVLALGFQPVGIPHSLLDYGVFLREVVSEDVADIGNHNSPSLEAMAALEPDLIITWGEQNYENYAKIAPTVVFQPDAYASMAEEMTAMGEILNRQQEAMDWNQTFEQRVAAARAKIAGVVPEGATFTVADYDSHSGKMVWVVGLSTNRGGYAAYELLGLTPAPGVQSEIIDAGEFSKDVSWEAIESFAGDYIFNLRIEDGRTEPAVTWNSLPAVSNNQVYELDLRKYFTADPYSAIRQAEEMADRLASGATSLK